MSSKDTPPDEPLWTAEETAILQSHMQAFVKGDKNTRKNLLIATVLPEMKRHRCNMTTEQWKRRKTQIKWWFYNHKERDKTDFDLGWKVHGKTIVSHLWGQQLRATAQEMSGEDAGSQAFLKVYSKVYSDFRKNMTPQQTQELKEAQDNWDVQHPPELQYKNAIQHSEKVLLSVAKMLYREFGMVVVIGEYHKVTEHQSAFVVHDYSNLVGHNRLPKSFTDLHPNLLNRFKTALIKYMLYDTLRSLEVPSDEDGGHESQAQSQTRSSTPGPRQGLELHCDEGGYPILPARTQAVESTREQRDLVRKFVTVQYRLACGRPDASVPWRLIAGDNTLFISGTYLNVKLEDPGIMSKPDLTELLKMWRGRQVDGPTSEVFRFQRCLDKRGGKATTCASYPDPVHHQTLGPASDSDRPEINMFSDNALDPSLWRSTSLGHPITSTQVRTSEAETSPISDHKPPLGPPDVDSIQSSQTGVATAVPVRQNPPKLLPPPPPLPVTSCTPIAPTEMQHVVLTEGDEGRPSAGTSEKLRSKRFQDVLPDPPIVAGRRAIKPTAKVIAAREQQVGIKWKWAISGAADMADITTKKARGA